MAERIDPPAGPESPATAPGLVTRAVWWTGERTRSATRWGVAARSTHRSVDVGFRLADRDKRVAAGVLAGGLAYRLFFWMLSVSVLSTGGLGLIPHEWLDQILATAGADSAVVDAVRDLAGWSEPGRWWLLLVGAWLVLWTGYLGAKALVLVHAAVWMMPAPPAEETLAGVAWLHGDRGRAAGLDGRRRATALGG